MTTKELLERLKALAVEWETPDEKINAMSAYYLAMAAGELRAVITEYEASN